MSEASPAADAGPAAETGLSRRRGHFDNRELSTIAMLAALHFVVSFAAKTAGMALYAALGPFYIFPDGIGGELIPSLLVATTVALVPRIGTAALTMTVVALLNAIVGGSFAVASLVQLAASVCIYELILGVLGVTLESPWTRPAARISTGLLLRTALAVGLANGAALYVQYFISMTFYQFRFDMWFVHAACLVTGVGYGTIGAALGAALGFQLRRTAP
jgi:hypothetical protein